MIATATHDYICDDFIISWAAHQRGIPIVESTEIRSRWRRLVTNHDLRYAVTHPHKLDRLESSTVPPGGDSRRPAQPGYRSRPTADAERLDQNKGVLP